MENIEELIAVCIIYVTYSCPCSCMSANPIKVKHLKCIFANWLERSASLDNEPPLYKVWFKSVPKEKTLEAKTKSTSETGEPRVVLGAHQSSALPVRTCDKPNKWLLFWWWAIRGRLWWWSKWAAEKGLGDRK